LTVEFVTMEFSTAGRPLSVECTISERDTLTLPLTVEPVSEESRMVAVPLTVLPLKVEWPEMFARPFTCDRSINLLGPDTMALPQMVESLET
jgi:hypothetical protein